MNSSIASLNVDFHKSPRLACCKDLKHDYSWLSSYLETAGAKTYDQLKHEADIELKNTLESIWDA